jgi:cobaltochelatase CobN
VRGLRLEPQPETVPAPRSDSVVRTLWTLFGMAALLALGALTQWQRHRRPRPAL